jgi:uracil-DNA glycosylase family 4
MENAPPGGVDCAAGATGDSKVTVSSELPESSSRRSYGRGEWFLVKRTGGGAIVSSAQAAKAGRTQALVGFGERAGSRQLDGSGQLLPGMEQVRQTIVGCERCSRLRDYCREIGETRRRAYIDQEYWARPVPGFGDVKARILVLGLAPGAHGANRTGRPFTGDGSGYFMYPVLHELGLASSPNAVSRDDGLKLRHAWICSVVRCAPPADKPTPQEVRNCAIHLAAEIQALKKVRVVVCLGKIAWDGFLAHLLRDGVIARRSEYTFGHGVEYVLPNGLYLLASYHPSLRNTNTGRLNRTMFARVFVRARELAGLG